MKVPVALLAALMLSSCGPPAEAPTKPTAPPPALPGPLPAPAAPDLVALPPVEPREPGTPGGFPDDRTPISEAPFTPQSAQGAADVVQVYFALIGQKKYAEAWTLWGQDGQASGMTQDAFVASFDRYHQYNGQVGAPGAIEGAAGLLYVEVPAQAYGRLKTGEEFHLFGPIRLRRVNDVPGSTAEQRLWRIAESGMKPVP